MADDRGVTVRSWVTLGGDSVTLGFLETLGDPSSSTISEAHSAWFMWSEVGLLLRLESDGRIGSMIDEAGVVGGVEKVSVSGDKRPE